MIRFWNRLSEQMVVENRGLTVLVYDSFVRKEKKKQSTVKPRFSTTIRSESLFQNRIVREPNHIFPLQIM